jgi:predicted ATP-grasp superfamily ATP-dependent carboligase
VATVLILDGNSGPAVATARSLGRAGYTVLAGAGTRAGASRHTAACVPLPLPTTEPDAFLRAIAEALAIHHVDLLAPSSDAAVELVWSGDAISLPILGGDHASFTLCSDKASTLAAADRAGFPTPEWSAPESIEEAEAALARIRLPCVVKPRRSWIRVGGRLEQRRYALVQRREHLAPAVEALRDAQGALPVLQAYAPGRSLSVSAVVHRGEVLAYVPIEKLSAYPLGGGTGVWRRTLPPDAVGVQESLRLLQAIGYEGLAQVEYQVGADGRPALMEINARLHGYIALPIAAGADLPLIAARALLGCEAVRCTSYRVGLEQRWLHGEAWRLRDALLARGRLPAGSTRRGVVAAAWPPWRPGMRYDELDLRDPWPYLPGRARRARAPEIAP